MKNRKKATSAGASRKTGRRQGRSSRAAVSKAAAAAKAAGAAKKADAAKKPGREPSDGVFKLPAECVVSGAGSLKADLARIIGCAEPVTLDAEQVQRIDTAALQVVASFVQERDKDGHATVWMGGAQALVSAAKLLGLSEILRLPAESVPAEVKA